MFYAGFISIPSSHFSSITILRLNFSLTHLGFDRSIAWLSIPIASEGELREREFTYIAGIKVLERFDPPVELPGRLSDFLDSSKIAQCRSGIVRLDREDFCTLYRVLTGRECPY